jgi:RNA polymerase sigma-70 factor (ECF subfamily)
MMDRPEYGDRLTDLVQRANRGDTAALERLLTRVHVYVLRYFRRWLYRRTGLEETAEDLAQETLIRIAGALGEFRGGTDAEMMVWCRTVAMNIGTDYLRAKRAEWDLGAMHEEIAAVHPGLDGPWNADELAGSEGMRILLRLLERAQTEEMDASQALLWHRLVQGDSWAGTGETLDIPDTAAKRRYQRAQERLRRAVLRSLVKLPLHELQAVRRWMAHRDLAET